MFNLVAFAIMEISLLKYLLAPQCTVNTAGRRRTTVIPIAAAAVEFKQFNTGLAAVGCVSLTAGVAS